MSDPIKMIAGDTVHISRLGPDPLREGDPFEVYSEADAKHFERLGHKRAGASAKPAPAPENKGTTPTKKKG